MLQTSSQTRDTAARLVVIDLLGHAHGRRRLTLYQHLRHHDHETINAAIASLVGAGIITASGDHVMATPALAYLEALALIAV
jgi:hypothetical protein